MRLGMRVVSVVVAAVFAVLAAGALSQGSAHAARDGRGAGGGASQGEKKQDRPKAPFKREWTHARDDAQWKRLNELVGKPARDFVVGNWSNEAPPPVTRLKGKIVLVDFWATWCGPCRKAVPHTNAVMDRYRERGVVVLGVCCSEEGGGGSMQKAVKDLGIRFPTAQDRGGSTAKAWGVQWWPFYVLVDRQGVVRMAGLHANALDQAIQALLEEQPEGG